jgi:hypothetical protein
MAAPAQARGPGGPPPIGVVYNTSMARPDAALALAALHIMANRREARVGAVCVSGAGLGAAVFCDIVHRFYVPGNRSSNAMLPVGLAAVQPLPPDPPMVRAAITRLREDGEPAYVRSVRAISDTSLAEAVLRNGVIMTAESTVVLSAPATWLARSLDLAGTKAQYAQRVKRLVVVDDGTPQRDPAALRKIVAEWPTPMFVCRRDIGDALAFPSAAVDSAFGWAPAHPLADAYRAFQPMPYDAPLWDLAAMYFTVHPSSPFFRVSEPGTLAVSDAGAMSFAPGEGNVRRVTVDPSSRDAAIAALVEILGSTPPAPPAGRGRG